MATRKRYQLHTKSNGRLEMKAGRPKIEGHPRKYMVADDVHEWIVSHGGSQYLNNTIRIIKAVQQ